MTKDQVKAISEEYKFQIIRQHITNEGIGIWKDIKNEIPELDTLIDSNQYHRITATKEYMPNGMIRYKVYCPKSWFDLWGWTD